SSAGGSLHENAWAACNFPPARNALCKLKASSMVMVLRPTMELSHAGPRTKDTPRLHGKPGTLPGAGSSDLVRLHRAHPTKNKVQNISIGPLAANARSTILGCRRMTMRMAASNQKARLKQRNRSANS